MKTKAPHYKAIVSSDWNECLAPCGPFDPFVYLYPQLKSSLAEIFSMYTSNRITLGEAIRRIRDSIPSPVTTEQMDAYLDSSFVTYKGVATLIEECLRRDILFMINTTGMMGYFQRIFARRLLPRITAVAANPFITYPSNETDPPLLHHVVEIEDKAGSTALVMKSFGIPGKRVILIGDSGGDGPHFEWGRSIGAFLIGSMTKPSLERYCRERGIQTDLRFGLSYEEGERIDHGKEMAVDFAGLVPAIEEALKNNDEC